MAIKRRALTAREQANTAWQGRQLGAESLGDCAGFATPRDEHDRPAGCGRRGRGLSARRTATDYGDIDGQPLARQNPSRTAGADPIAPPAHPPQKAFPLLET